MRDSVLLLLIFISFVFGFIFVFQAARAEFKILLLRVGKIDISENPAAAKEFAEQISKREDAVSRCFVLILGMWIFFGLILPYLESL